LAQGRVGVVNMLHDKLGEPLANQKRKKKGRRVLSFTGGGGRTEAAALRARGASGACACSVRAKGKAGAWARP
jgi:hypothetical protein